MEQHNSHKQYRYKKISSRIYKKCSLGNGLRENGVAGLGGVLYIFRQCNTAKKFQADSIFLNSVRIQNDAAYTGSAVYSDNYDLNFALTRCLVTSNKSTSPVGRNYRHN